MTERKIQPGNLERHGMSLTRKAENVRDVIRYLRKFRNAVVVIYLDDRTIDSPLFSSHIRDIALLHEAGLRVLIIPGARKRIDEVLFSAGISSVYRDNIRVTEESAMPLIKMAAFDVSNVVMTSLAANGITAVIGNWVRSRSKGIIDGFDFGTAGEIDRIHSDSIRTVLDSGFIPIFPCIGWNSVGRPYNISSVLLAYQVAVSLKADKLFYMLDISSINSADYSVPENFAQTESGDIPAMNLEETDEFLSLNANAPDEILSVVRTARSACADGVTRAHIVTGRLDGVLPCEIFSDLGSGTMIYTSDYGGIRQMRRADIPSVLAIQRPFVESGKLLPRTEMQISDSIGDYIVYELDGGIHACAALHLYSDGQAEIAAVAVENSFVHLGIGRKLTEYLIDKADRMNASGIFIMTTQAADWFEKLGFRADGIESLPEERRALWNPGRNSRVYRLR